MSSMSAISTTLVLSTLTACALTVVTAVPLLGTLTAAVVVTVAAARIARAARRMDAILRNENGDAPAGKHPAAGQQVGAEAA